MKKALISVSDKTKLIPLAQTLSNHGYEIISTGGTKTALEHAGFTVTSVSDLTGFPEMLDGRVKTLHPHIHAGLLAKREEKHHMQTLETKAINPIDVLVVNLYPFKETIENDSLTKDDAIEQIDIGGPALLRSAAKNMTSVTALCDPSDYQLVIDELHEFKKTTVTTKQYLAQKVFKHTAQYDLMIADYLAGETTLSQTWVLKDTLRYGENPHQKGYLYQAEQDDPYSLFNAEILHGKPLSYNNIQDANAAINILSDFDDPTAVALKHMNPCGVASSNTIETAFEQAYQSDMVSIFGGIVAINKPVTLTLAKKLHTIFLEIIIAPSYDTDALAHLKQKKNIRLLALPMSSPSTESKMMTSINGGMLIQDTDNHHITESDLTCVTKQAPNEAAIAALLFAWRVAKYVKSNAIVVAKGQQTVGVGAGQMNRVGAAEIALNWAAKNGQTENLVLASDAFLPFDDVVRLAHRYGVTHIIQPGGSKRDQASIDACDELGITMVFTGVRHFAHR